METLITSPKGLNEVVLQQQAHTSATPQSPVVVGWFCGYWDSEVEPRNLTILRPVACLNFSAPANPNALAVPDWDKEREFFALALPGGIGLVGLYFAVSDPATGKEQLQTLLTDSHSKRLDWLPNDRCIVALVSTQSNPTSPLFFAVSPESSLVPASVHERGDVLEHFLASHILVQARGHVPCALDSSSYLSSLSDSLDSDQELWWIRSQVECLDSEASSSIPQSLQVLSRRDSAKKWGTIRWVPKQKKKPQGSSVSDRGSLPDPPLVMLDLAQGAVISQSSVESPSLRWRNEGANVSQFDLKVDTVLYVRREEEVGKGLEALKRGLVRQIRYLEVSKTVGGISMGAYHFKPPGLPFVITAIYKDDPDDPLDESQSFVLSIIYIYRSMKH